MRNSEKPPKGKKNNTFQPGNKNKKNTIQTTAVGFRGERECKLYKKWPLWEPFACINHLLLLKNACAQVSPSPVGSSGTVLPHPSILVIN